MRQRQPSPTCVHEAAPTNAGVHVYRRRLEACLAGRNWAVPNDLEGWHAMTADFKASGVDLVAIDAIGGFERGLTRTLQADGLAVVRVGTRQALDFARSRGAARRAVRVDARTLRDLADALVSWGSDFILYMPQSMREAFHPRTPRTAPSD